MKPNIDSEAFDQFTNFADLVDGMRIGMTSINVMADLIYTIQMSDLLMLFI